MEKKEAMKILKDFHDKSALFSVRTALDTIIPELKESEDEKIKELIHNLLTIDTPSSREIFSIYGKSREDVTAWLEKQGESSVQIHYWTEEEIEPIISDYLRGAENYGGMIGRLRCLKPKSFEKQGRQEQLYIRFGEIPTDEKSKIYQGEIEVGIENGVSVYPAFKTNEGDIVLGLTLPITKTTLYTQQYLIEYDDRPCYLVKGDYVGKDTDGQPLISNVSIVEKIDSYRIKEEKQGEKPQGKSALEVIKEEKVDNANKIEPKFHKGEWVVWNNQYYKVNYNSCGYELVDQNGLSTSLEYGTVDKSAHVFSIKDAKDGDVLVCEDFGYTSLMLFESFSNGRILLHCWHNSQTNNFHINTDVELRKNAKVYPATKEQRDVLIKAITDAGYTFDFEKKELKKLEKQGNQDVAEDSAKVSESSTEEKDMTEYKKGYACGLQRVLKYPEDFNLYKKFEWSEEDETGLTNIIIMLKEGASHHFIKDDITKAVAWLKSLKPHKQ